MTFCLIDIKKIVGKVLQIRKPFAEISKHGSGFPLEKKNIKKKKFFILEQKNTNRTIPHTSHEKQKPKI
jgi:hypothetical protein